MLRVRHNTKYAPYKLRDIIMRDNVVGCSNIINDDLYREIGTTWFYYITQTASYYHGNTEIQTNIITAYIFDNFKDRVMLDKYENEFIDWTETTDFSVYLNMVKNSIAYLLKCNTEKYNKLFYAMIAEFNPLWNVDGTEITERELRQTGTIDDTKTGTETAEKTGTETGRKTGTETTDNTGTVTLDKTGTDTTAKSGTETTDNTGTETTANTGTVTNETSNTTYDSSTYYNKEKNVETRNTTDTKTLNTENETTYNTEEQTTHNTEDETTYNTEEQTTHNTTDTLTHDTTDETTYNTLNSNERDLLDTERIKVTRQGNIGVTTTTKLLTEFVEYSDLVKFLDIVARDIVNTITYMTY